MDHTAGINWLTTLLSLQGVTATVSSQMRNDGTGEDCWLVIDSAPLSSEQIQALQGERGAVLDAVQYLANTTLNLGKPREQQQAYTVELDGYRTRRLAELQQLAEAAAEQVRQTGEQTAIPGLSSAERRQVHHLLTDYTDLETYSQGTEPDRRLVVRPVSSSAPDASDSEVSAPSGSADAPTQ